MANQANLSRRNLLKLSSGLISSLAVTGVATNAAFAKVTAVNGAALTYSKQNPIRINYNENAFGMAAKSVAAAQAALLIGNRYFMPQVAQLKQQIAAGYGASEAHFLLTAGSSQAIRATFEALGQLPGVQLVIPELTYADGEHFATIAKMKITKVPMNERWEIDLAKLADAVDNHFGPSVVYLVNPNNPTGSIVNGSAVEAWIRKKTPNTYFIVDEAYAEYVNNPQFKSVANLIKEGFDNVILLKTFSKIYALAGLRIGFAYAHPRLITAISQYDVVEMLNGCAVAAAQAVFQDGAFIAASKASNDMARKIIVDALASLKITYLPPEGNFIFFELPNTSLEQFQTNMLDAGVLVGRAFPPANKWCRMSLGTPAEMREVVKVMQRLNEKKLL